MSGSNKVGSRPRAGSTKPIIAMGVLAVLGLCIAGMVLPEEVHSADGDFFSQGALEYTILSETDRTVEVYYYSQSDDSYSSELVIPSTVTHDGVTYTVTAIDADAVWSDHLLSLTIPSTVVDIDDAPFDTSNLVSVTVEEGNTAFTSVDGVLFSVDMTRLVYYPPAKVGSYAIPDTVTYAVDAFTDVKDMDTVHVPAGLVQMGDDPFYDSYIMEVVVDPANPVYASEDGVLFDKDMKELLRFPAGRSGAYTVPASVTTMGEWSFHNASLVTSVVLPAGLTSIEDYAFYYCVALESVVMPGVTTIGGDAFSECASLQHVDMPVVETIGSYAFYECASLQDITIPDTTTSIGSRAFYGCTSLEAIHVDDGNTTFSSVDGVLFEGTELVCFPATRTGDYTVPVTTTVIGPYAFHHTHLTSLTIPHDLEVESYAITNSDHLVTLDMPALTYSQYGMVRGCSALEYVDMSAMTCVDGDMFDSCPSLRTVHMSSVTDIEGYAFGGCSSLEELVLPASLSYIGYMAFADCTSLRSVVFNEGLEYIGGLAFSGCTSLVSLSLPSTLEAIGSQAFSECDSLQTVTIPAGVTFIGNYVFRLCPSLTSITVDPANPEYASVDGVLFTKDMTWLIKYPAGSDATSYTVPEGVVNIDFFAFMDADSLVSVTLPDSLAALNASAFAFCSSLETVDIPAGVTFISNNRVFRGCDSLTAVNVDPANPEYASVDGVLYSKDMTELFLYPAGKDGASYSVPDGVEYIYMIAGSSLEVIRIPASVTFISSVYPFDGCDSLTAFVVDPANPEYASKDGVLFTKDLSTIEAYPVAKGESYTIPEGVEHIGNIAFYGNQSIASITLPSTLKSITYESLSYTDGLELVIMHDGRLYLENYVFAYAVDPPSFVSGVSGYDLEIYTDPGMEVPFDMDDYMKGQDSTMLYFKLVPSTEVNHTALYYAMVIVVSVIAIGAVFYYRMD